MKIAVVGIFLFLIINLLQYISFEPVEKLTVIKEFVLHRIDLTIDQIVHPVNCYKLQLRQSNQLGSH